MYGIKKNHNGDLPKCNLYSWNKHNKINHTLHVLLFFTLTRTTLPLGIGLYFVLNPWSIPSYKITMAPLSRNDQSIKSTHILKKTCSMIKMVLMDTALGQEHRSYLLHTLIT